MTFDPLTDWARKGVEARRSVIDMLEGAANIYGDWSYERQVLDEIDAALDTGGELEQRHWLQLRIGLEHLFIRRPSVATDTYFMRLIDRAGLLSGDPD